MVVVKSAAARAVREAMRSGRHMVVVGWCVIRRVQAYSANTRDGYPG
jgi:cell division inhibitor SulA